LAVATRSTYTGLISLVSLPTATVVVAMSSTKGLCAAAGAAKLSGLVRRHSSVGMGAGTAAVSVTSSRA